MATDITTESPAESAEDLAKRFAKLAAKWDEETRFSSKMGQAAQHPAYQEIIAMGARVVPLLLADLEKGLGTQEGPEHWFIALRTITGSGPLIPKEDRGKIDRMAAAWIAWGREQGYRWEHAV